MHHKILGLSLGATLNLLLIYGYKPFINGLLFLFFIKNIWICLCEEVLKLLIFQIFNISEVNIFLVIFVWNIKFLIQ